MLACTASNKNLSGGQ